jgi:hypothetical protein
MQHVSRVLVLVVLLLSVPAHARTGAEVHKDVLKAAKVAVAVYRAHGMSGLIGTTQRCYDQSHNQGFSCVYLDFASRRIDQLVRAAAARDGMPFQKMAFFDNASLGSRLAPVFRQANMDREKSHAYVRVLTPIINQLVDEEKILHKQ